MIDLIKSVDRKAINAVFGLFYAFTLLMALFPPLYLSASGQRDPILFGIPWSIFYWIVDAALVGIALGVYYLIENIRGEAED